MIRVGGIRVSLDTDFSRLEDICAKKLKIDRSRLISVREDSMYRELFKLLSLDFGTGKETDF